MTDKQDFWDIACLIYVWRGASVEQSYTKASELTRLRQQRIIYEAELDELNEEKSDEYEQEE